MLKDFTVSVTDAAELTGGTRPSKLVIENAKFKAKAIAADSETVVIAADTVVYYKGEYFLKPKSIDGAFKMLKKLSGNVHYVYTGVCVRRGDSEICFYDKSAVKMKKLTDAEIADYIKTDSPLDKAGAYGIQDNVAVASYTGSYTNIIGLPLEKLSEALKAFGIG